MKLIRMQDYLTDPEKRKKFTEQHERAKKKAELRAWKKKVGWKSYSPSNPPIPEHLR